MNEPTTQKRRGRLSNVEKAARDAEIAERAVLHGAEMRLGFELTVFGSSEINPAQEYANRVWAGQSDDVPREERLERVRKALEGQGLSMVGVELPNSPYVAHNDEEEARKRALATPVPVSTIGIV